MKQDVSDVFEGAVTDYWTSRGWFGRIACLPLFFFQAGVVTMLLAVSHLSLRFIDAYCVWWPPSE